VSEAVRVISEERFELAESPRWNPARHTLMFVDLLAGRLHEHDYRVAETTRVRVHEFGQAVGVFAETPTGLVAGVGSTLVSIDDFGAPEELIDLGQGDRLRTNDGACDPQGRLVFGLMTYDATPGAGLLARLERIDNRWTTRPLLQPTTVSNGVAWSPDGTAMYHVDSATREIRAYSYGETIGDARTLASIDARDGEPDGICVDALGHIWVALWDGGEVRRYGADGELRDRISVPARRPTAVCLGDHDLRTLFITSATYGLSDPTSYDGAIFAVRVDTPGLSPVPWIEPAAGPLDADADQ
jgi:sugar lactone lactonase YvrE